jgi:hypothetical protein
MFIANKSIRFDKFADNRNRTIFNYSPVCRVFTFIFFYFPPKKRSLQRDRLPLPAHSLFEHDRVDIRVAPLTGTPREPLGEVAAEETRAGLMVFRVGGSASRGIG